MQKQVKGIDKKTTLEKLLKIKGVGKVLAENGVPCLSCPMAQFEMDELEIGKICAIYGLNLEKIIGQIKNLK